MRAYLWDPWQTAALQPDRPAVISASHCWGFAELVDRADALRGGLHGLKMADGAVIATDIPTGPRFFSLALAALRGGFGLFPVPRELLRSPVGAELLRSMGVVLLVTDAPPESEVPLPCPTMVDEDVAAAAAGTVPFDSGRAGYLAYATSGTTGEPQAVPRARPRRRYRGVAVEERYGAGITYGPYVMANPGYHLGTLGPALYALQAGSTVVVLDAWSPDTFARAVDEYGADSAMLSPDLLIDLTETGRAPQRRLRAVFHAGAACPPAVKDAAIALLGPVLHEYYGTSRSILTEITTPEWLHRRGSVGRPLPGIGILVRGPGGATAAPGRTGEICALLRPADGLSGRQELLPTGDLGFLDADGYLYVVGRGESGQQDRAARLEYEIRLLLGVTDVAVLEGDDEVVCFVEAGRGAGPLLTAQIHAAVEQSGLTRAPRVEVLPAGALPRTLSGKVHRAALRD